MILESAQDRKLFIAALGLSFLVHGFLLWTFRSVSLRGWAIPIHREKLRAFELKRVEIPASSFQGDPRAKEPISVSALAMSTPRFKLPRPNNAQEPLDSRTWQTALPEAASGKAPELAVVAPTPPTAVSPYAQSELAKVDTEIAQLANDSSRAGVSRPELILPSSSGSSYLVGATEQGILSDATRKEAAGSAIPGIEEIQSRLRAGIPPFSPSLSRPVVIQFPNEILFDFDSANLRASAEPYLQQVVEILRRYRRADVQIDGYTDTFGDDLYNLRLSEARAESVRRWLAQFFPPDRVTFHTRGYGKSHPVVNPYGTIEEQERNRRVVIMIHALTD
ncbi:OmpA family protein [Candidatus Methylacidithermus pantelleriae]|uniref:Outer membrane protein or related peptidoglycan-associated (Lipo)protein n=1 Tax=Candidatus Methylacidithermus pantelleriae TaxID=2744239 RepID=A0A8J2BLN8_9BACT|nr:OmpA family protein [Candidatus Methylacidithermus pantelleriae]CAF0693943.1 Outer membrane protein or related peptidoglycan-associated (Lipo)protein [Candidatus Methylacidithermus pantelleriae]